jgi:membrane protease YdiL (CAAX protease family)
MDDNIKGLARLFPKWNWKITLMTVISTLLIMLDYYFNWFGNRTIQEILLFLVIPLLIILIIYRESPVKYGLAWGDWKAGLFITVISILLAAPLVWFTVRFSTSMQNYYAVLNQKNWPLITILELVGWEFFFRGWLLFGYEREFGGNALWLQAVPFALAHLSKPGIETLSTIFGGFYFGWVAWRTRSFIYPFIIHVFVSGYAIWFASLVTAVK